jgi:outer membrane biosynthesis protein TonB
MIDFDNVTMGIRSNLGQEIRKLLESDVIRGKVSVQRAYADWRRYPQYIVPLSEASVDLIFAPAYGSSKKNATDIRLAIDAIEIVFTRPEIGTYILLSGDSDFSSLVLKLKEYGKYVIGVGMKESSSDLLVQNCDEYYSYNSLSGLTSAHDVVTETFDPWVLAARTIQRMVERKDVMRSDRFKQVMLEFDSSFSERSLGFSKFNRFLSEAASRGIITLEKAANGQYEVALGARADEVAKRSTATPAPSPSRPSRSPSRSRGSSRSRGRSSSRRPASQETREAPPSDQPAPEVDEDRLRTAYDLLKSVVADLAKDGGMRDSEIKRQMLKRQPQFDEAALGFSKFSRFLRQAHDEEVINLDQGAEGNYLVSPSDASEQPDSSPPAEKAPAAAPDRPRRGRGRSRSERSPREPESAPAAEEPVMPEPEVAEPAAASAAPVEPESEPEAAPKPEARRGLGRFRRGSKGRSPAPKPAPKPAAPSEPVTKPRQESKAEVKAEPRPERKPEPKSEAKAEPKAETRPAAKSAAGSGKHSAEVERMSRRYSGVGKRTAERLYEEFGSDLLSVIDNNPEKIKGILPEHRARAVIDGRRVEREANGAG